MYNCELSIEKEIELMIAYQLTADELFLVKLIFYAQDGREKYLSQFFSQDQLSFKIIDLLKSLQEKGVINKSYRIPSEGTVFNPRDVEFNKNFIKSFLQHSEDLGMEIFMAYPTATVINGTTFSLRNIAKQFKTMDDFCWEYGKSIKFDLNKHREVLDLLEWAKENNLINSGICDFVISRKWLDLKDMKDNELGTFNTNELV